ncbi:hypothetical protein FKW77_002162 [Venturia effusa]|uniref:Uncharacterized protein n=1 Tax=Venturia effusa TaxID=50376 RepID=A0A517LI92_9PEZI|nr:hypothetical protein FKW77_002162 [Venturia effusa]
MGKPAQPSEASSGKPKKVFQNKESKKAQVKTSAEPTDITSSITPLVTDEHSPKQPKSSNTDTRASSDIPPDRNVMNTPAGPPKVLPVKSGKSNQKNRRETKNPMTAVVKKVDHVPAASSETILLPPKICNSKQVNTVAKQAKESFMQQPRTSVTKPEIYPSSEESRMAPSKMLQKSAPRTSRRKRQPESGSGIARVKGFGTSVIEHHNSENAEFVGISMNDQNPTIQSRNQKQKQKKKKKERKSSEPSGGVPLCGSPQLTSGECGYPQTANLADSSILPPSQESSIGSSKHAQMPTILAKGKEKFDEKRHDPQVKARAFKSHQAKLTKYPVPRRQAPIDENVESAMGESSTSVPPTLQRSSTTRKRKKRVEKTLAQPASELPPTEPAQNQPGQTGRAKIARNLAQVFAVHQGLVRRHQSQKSIAQAKKFPFLHLPRELRDMIIKYTIDYDGIDAMLVKINNTFPSDHLRSRKFDKKLQQWMTELDGVYFRSVPTIFCLNHQIYGEAQEMLRKEPLRISHPPQYPIKGIYDLSHVISDDALCKVAQVQFELYTYPAAERRHDVLQQDWKGESVYKDEYLAESYPWAMLLKDCFQVWRGTPDPRYLKLSIDHCSSERSEFNLAVFGDKLLALEDCVDTVLVSHDLDALMNFLIFADAPITFH